MKRRGGVLQPPVDLGVRVESKRGAKFPRTVAVEAVYRPSPIARERLLDLLVELLDAGGHSRGG